MTSQWWQRVEEVFEEAVTRPAPERAIFLDESCAGDTSMRLEVEALLAADARADGAFEDVVSGVAAEWAAESNADDLLGQTIGRYQIIKWIGSGGMGNVYLAQDTALDRKVALKLLPPEFTRDRDRLRRFEKEARAASALNHPNIITIYETGEWKGGRFIATEYVEGETLRGQTEKPGRDLSEVLEIGIQVSGALAAAHAAGIVHRDIKPANIMLRGDGYVKLLDFGLAKLTSMQTNPDITEAGRVLGTLNYMSPEQAMGQPLDHRTDIFSLGVVLYELATGRRLFEGQSEAAVYDSILHKDPPPLREFAPIMPVEFDQVVRRALEKDPARRYQSAADLRRDLKRLQRGSEMTDAARIASRERRAASRARTLRFAALAAVIAGIIAIAALIGRQFGSSAPNDLSKKSIAVLPFENLSEEKQSEYFAEGVQDQVLTDLAKVADLKVISRSSVLQYKAGVARNLREIGRQLGVKYLLEGTVQRSGGKLRVNAQLVSAKSDAQVWAETYDRNLSDVFAVQSEIAKAIASQLQAKLSPNERKALEQSPTTDLLAFDLYSQAKSLMLTASFSATNEADVRKAIELSGRGGEARSVVLRCLLPARVCTGIALRRGRFRPHSGATGVGQSRSRYRDPAAPGCCGDAFGACAISLLRRARLRRRAVGIENRARCVA